MKILKGENLIFIVIGYLIFLFIKKKMIDDNKESEIDKEIKEEEEKQSYPNSQYYSFADSLESSMENAGTDEESIYSIFRKIKNNKDFLLLQKAFGNRTYSGELFGGLTSLVDPTEDSLEQWLRNELSSQEVQKVNKILSNNRVTYRI